MCLIVEANLAGLVFRSPPDSNFVPVLDWLEKDGCLILGGRLGSELVRLAEAQRYLLALLRAGRAKRVAEEVMTAEEEAVLKTGLCRSNDCHVLALARASGARTLCTHDKALQKDFRNPQLISKPRGSVYQRKAHARLLRHTRSCRWLPRIP
jgi:hypothetical protein